ncbi:MAG: hypothetical protein AAGU05_01050, partial [Anaerolineaceae bacterium]
MKITALRGGFISWVCRHVPLRFQTQFAFNQLIFNYFQGVSAMSPIRTLIMGAAGRDFHNFNVFFRGNKNYQVVAFTATQIPDIEGRMYPAVLAGDLYPEGIPIYDESELLDLIRKHNVEQVVFAYSDQPHEVVMHKASKVIAAGPDFVLMGS